MSERDFDINPYSPQEGRAARWFSEKVGVGGGDDPVGSLIASHEALAAECTRLRSELEQARASLKECAGILETLVDPAKQHISSVHIYAQSFEAIVRSRSILAVASPERRP